MKFFMCLSFLLIHVSAASAKLQVGRILKSNGDAIKINNSNAESEAALFWGDQLLTGKDTTVEVLIYPSFSIKLWPSTNVKLIGSLIGKQDAHLSASSVVQIIAGKIQGQVIKKSGDSAKVRIFGNRTISSIRGTVFEVDTESETEAVVYEGKVEVQVPAINKSFVVQASEALNLKASKPVVEANASPAPQLATGKEIEAVWAKDAASVLASHEKEAKNYKKSLDRDVSGLNQSLKKDASGVFKNLKGIYGKKDKSN